MIQVVASKIEHGYYILNHLRAEQKRTLRKLNFDAPSLIKKALTNGYPSLTLLVDGEPAAIFGGSSETMLGEVRLWLLTTPLVLKHTIAFLRASRETTRWMFTQYGPMIGIVDAEFEASKRWLQWIGFKEVQNGDYIVMRYSNGH